MGGYSDTLNLLETPFPMRAKLAQREPDMLQHTQDTDLYGRIRAAAAGRPPYVLHDGPPYANGAIHLGHVVNKTLKDFVVRSKNVLGYDATYIPGWDCHGLPIERELEKREVSKADPIEFRRKCRAFAAEQMASQRVEFERLGVLGDWNNHYSTMKPSTEGDIIRALGALMRTGLVYRGLRPVLHCPVCESSLAEAEIEYADRTSQAVDVAFAFADPAQAAKAFGLAAADKFAVVIWTTTAWTLPGNLFVCYGPDIEYVALKTERGLLALAADLVESCQERWGLEGEIVGKARGADLDGLVCRHPFYDRASPLHPGDHVSTEEGTGFVHSAPAHGQEDYEAARPHGYDATSPVDERCRFYDRVELFGGESIWQAVPLIVKTVEERGALICASEHQHSYPVCWRHKEPVIYRTSQQWFVAMDEKGAGEQTLRERSLAAIENTEYFPAWGKERMAAMVASRPDWCLSRQRMWNSPVAFFVDRETGDLHPRTDELIEKIAAVVSEGGIEAWFAMDASELLGAEADRYIKVSDTLDVWFDSGVTHQAVMHWAGGAANRPDMYLEGSDQHRGWFMSSLMTACALYGEPPWRQVLTHGFVVGGDGKKMSKSMGNAMAPHKLLSTYGADILRMWVAMSDYSHEIKLSDDILKTNVDSYRLLRNRVRFMLANLADFDPARDAVPVAELAELDRYMLVRTEMCRQKVFDLYDRYSFLGAMQAIHGFCSGDLGRFYFDIIKDRLYTLPAGSRARRSAQTALHHIAKTVLVGLGPTLSFTADEAWQVLCGDPEESTMLHTLAPLPEVADADKLAARWERIRHWRSQVSKEVENGRAGKRITCPDVELKVELAVPAEDHEHLASLSAEDLAAVFIVSEISLREGEGEVLVDKSAKSKCGRCWRCADGVGEGEHPEICARCEQALAGEANDRRQA